MVEFDNTNKGALFKSDRRERESQPEYTGSINVDGKEYWLSAWIKAGKRGKFFSLSVRPKDVSSAPGGDAKKSLSEELDGDSIPF